MKQSANQIFKRIFFSYFLVLLIPFLVILAIYFVCMQTITDFSHKQANMVLNQAILSSDTRLRELEAVALYIRSDPNVIDAANANNIRPNSRDLYKIYKACRNMPSYTQSNSLIRSVQVFLKKTPYMITPGYAIKRDETEDQVFEGLNISSEALEDVLWKRFFYNAYIQLENKDEHNVYMANSIFSSSSQSVLGVSLINIDNSFFQEMLQGMQPNQKGLAYILGENGELIYSFAGEECDLSPDKELYSQWLSENNSPEGYMLYSSASAYTGWIFCNMVPATTVYGDTDQIKYLIFALGITATLLGLLISLLFTQNKAKVLKRILIYLGDVNQDSKTRDAYSYIEDSVSNLVRDHHRLHSLVSLQKPLLEAASLRKLILEPWDENEFELSGSQNSFPKDARFLVALIKIRPVTNFLETLPSKQQFTVSQMKNLLHANSTDTVYLLDLDNLLAVVLFFCAPGQDEGFLTRCKLLMEHVVQSLKVEDTPALLFFTSNADKGLNKVHNAYCQALEVSKKAMLLPDNYIYDTDTLFLKAQSYYYPLEVEMKLLQFAKRGNAQKVKELLTEIYVKNFVEQAHSNDTLKNLVLSMRSSIVSNLKSMNVGRDLEEMIDKLLIAETIDEIFNGVVQVYLAVCETSNSKKAVQNNGKIREILGYMQENYQDYSFSIATFCSHFEMSEPQAYQYFREVIGQTFAQLLESIRIEKACELLQKGTLSVKDTALMCGYMNDGSFRRAFKRSMGISPSEYMQAVV